MQRYSQQYHVLPQQYHVLPQQYNRLQEPGAFRVVLAVRAPAAAAPAVPSSGSSSSSSSSSATAMQGTLGLNPSEEQLAVSARQTLNVEELLQWCNSWQPVAAGSEDLEGVDSSSSSSSSTVTAEGNRGKPRYSHTVCIAHEFGRHGKVDVPPRANSSSSSSSSSSWWGRLRRQLSGTQPLPQQQQQQRQQQQPWGDPKLDPRALMMDLAVLDNAGGCWLKCPFRALAISDIAQ
jgi:hypothetical protein